MTERNTDSVQVKDAAHSAAPMSEHDALINRVASEMANNKANSNLLSFQKAPENAAVRVGQAGLTALGHVPEGLLNAVVDNVKNPLQAVETIGMGAAFAVGLKTVLPEAGPAGKLAAAAIGGYFTYKAAEPILDGFSKAKNATTMADMHNASSQIGDAVGAFAVNTALAAGGYKLGAMAIEPVLASPKAKGFNDFKAGVYDNLTNKFSNALGITTDAAAPAGALAIMRPETMRAFPPSAYGVIPPHMLDEMVARNPKNADFLTTRNETVEMQSKSAVARPNAGTEDFKGARENYDAGGEENLPGKKVRVEGQKPSGNEEVDKAYDFTGAIRDFYKEVFGRNSIDGKGMKMVSTTNYGQNYENAFWNGSQMTYGRPGPESPFKTFMILDVAGHEVTHGITEMEAGTQYHGQSGALNESYSDVFGNLIVQKLNGQTADKADWLVGKGIWKDNVKGRGLRDMLNPGTAYDDPAVGKDPQPAHMKDYKKTWGDNGGVHYNSGIPNKAFATFARAVGGNAWEDPGHIWFDARKAAGSNPSFGSFAYYTIEAAKGLNKPDLVAKLEKSWADVGVKPDKNAVDTQTPVRPPDAAPDPAKDGNIIQRLFRRAS